MTIQEILNHAIKKLSQSTSPELDAEVLLSHIMNQPKEYLLTNPDKQISPKLEKQFHILLTRRAAGWPVAYIKNEKEFYGLKFYLDKNVLIPRPETEGLVDLIPEKIGIKYGLNILDVGTGSGNIIVTLAKKLGSKNRYFASDISSAVLKVATQNAKLHKTSISFKQSDILEAWKNQHFDVIVANLPYLARQTNPSTKFEPKQALIADKKGLAIIEELFIQIASSVIPGMSLLGLSPSIMLSKAGIQRQGLRTGSRIKSGMTELPKFVFLEIGHDQGPEIKKLATKYLPAFQTKIYKDLSGRNRYAVLQLL